MGNIFTFLRVYKDIANNVNNLHETQYLYKDLADRVPDSLFKWFEKSDPSHMDMAISIDAVAHEIHANGENVLQQIYPGTNYEVVKSTLDSLAGLEKSNDVRKLNRGFFTTLLSEDGFVFLEKQIARTVKEDISDAVKEYEKLFKAGIASKAEILTLSRFYPVDKTYQAKIIELGLDREENEPMVIGGPASVEMIDKEGHLITVGALKDAFEKFMDSFRTRNANLFHSDVQCGWILPAYINRQGEVFKSGVDDKGLWVISEIRDDSKIAKKVAEGIENGELKSYSIAGSATKTTPMQKGAQSYTEVSAMEMAEITLCLTGDAQIWTKSGLKSIKDIVVGDEVCTHNDRWCKVIKTMQREIDEEIIRLTTEHGIISLTKEHPVMCVSQIDSDFRYVWISAEKLEIGNLIYSSMKKRKDALSKILSTDKYNFMGTVYNLEVENDNSFLTIVGVVHNCAKGMNQGAHFDILKSEKQEIDNAELKLSEDILDDMLLKFSDDNLPLDDFGIYIGQDTIWITASDQIAHILKTMLSENNDMTVSITDFVPSDAKLLYKFHMVPIWKEDGEKMKVAYHTHDGWPEHPDAVKDHRTHFSTKIGSSAMATGEIKPWLQTREKFMPQPKYNLVDPSRPNTSQRIPADSYTRSFDAARLEIRNEIRNEKFDNVEYVKRRSNKQIVNDAASAVLRDMSDRISEELKDRLKMIIAEARSQGSVRTLAQHKVWVKNAIARGDYVPPEVLAEYPELLSKKINVNRETKWVKKINGGNMNATEIFKSFLKKEIPNEKERRKIHRELLDQYGFPDSPEDPEKIQEDTDEDIYVKDLEKRPHIINRAGQKSKIVWPKK